ncbi:MAG TPA: hypothetical protein VJ816_07185 [Gemmatimonadales bacterium]|nr:hypothetical protein [Gemmatimonadales bacterium]
MKQLLLAGLATLLHITPTVVLVKREDAVRRLVPEATAFTAREVRLSTADARRLSAAANWSPSEGIVTFYTGARDTRPVGALTFIRVDTPHGPIEVAVGLDTNGSVRGVAVTKVTVETKPWTLAALRAGLLDQYAGVGPGRAPNGQAAIRSKVGALPAFIAGEVDKAVTRALAAYRLFYRPSA